MRSHLDIFVDFMINADYDSFPDSVIERTKMVLIDNLGVTVYGNNNNEILNKTVELTASGGTSRILGLKNTFADPMLSALINSASAHSKQLDEAHWGAGGHPASYVVPAILSVAESKELSGKQVLTSIIVGYELAARLGKAYNRKKIMHPCGTYSIVGSSGAIGKLINQDAQSLKETIKLSANLTLATTASSALEGATVHDLFTGFTGYLGVMIPQLAEAGFRGEKHSLEMVFGTVSGENYNPEYLTENLGEIYEINNNFFKLHAVCGRNISAITAFGEILNEHKFTPEEIKGIKVETYKGAVEWCSNSRPGNELSAKFSIPFGLAGLMVFGDLFPDRFKDENLNNPIVKDICSKVEVVENEKMTTSLPSLRPAKVTIETVNGQSYSHEIQHHVGENEKLFSFDQICEKFIRLTSPILETKSSESVLALIKNIENVENINEITKLLNED